MKKQSIEYDFWCGSVDFLREYNALLNLVFEGRHARDEYLVWKHFDNPQGKSIIAFARYGGQLVGARAFQKTLCGDFLFFQPCDTATHPEFRRIGIFSKLTAMALDKSGDEIPVLNFPNSSSLPAYMKEGWEVYLRVKPKVNLNPLGVIGRYPKLISKGEADEIIEGLRDRCWRDYCKWRFLDNPRARYKYFQGETGLIVVNERRMSYLIPLSVSQISSKPVRILPILTYSYNLGWSCSFIDNVIHGLTGRGSNLVARRLRDYAALAAVGDVELSGLMDTF